MRIHVAGVAGFFTQGLFFGATFAALGRVLAEKLSMQHGLFRAAQTGDFLH